MVLTPNQRDDYEFWNMTGSWEDCRGPYYVITHGAFFGVGESQFNYSLALFSIQVSWILLVSRLLGIVLHPFKHPPFVSELLSGILGGPYFLGRFLPSMVLPVLQNPESTNLMSTFSTIGVMFWLFLAGSDIDVVEVMKNMKKLTAGIAIFSFITPVVGATLAVTILRWPALPWSLDSISYVFIGGFLISFTSFTTLVPFLVDLKLICTDVGKIALSSTLIKDVFCFVMLTFGATSAMARSKTYKLAPLYVVLLTALFISFLVWVVRPRLMQMARRWEEGEGMGESHICFLIVGVLGCAMTTDMIGQHPCFRAFVFGLIMPHGDLSLTLRKKIEDIAIKLFFPFFYSIVGIQMTFDFIYDKEAWILGFVCIAATITKMLGTYGVCRWYKLPLKDSCLLALLLDMRGVMELLYLIAILPQAAVSSQQFNVITISSLVTVMVICPAVDYINKKDKSVIPYPRRSVEFDCTRPSSVLRILTCVHSPENARAYIRIFQSASSCARTPLNIHAVRLVDLPDSNLALARASILIVNDSDVFGNTNEMQLNSSDAATVAFSAFRESSGMLINNTTALSPYKTMHKDVCRLAADKRIALILLPFHRQGTEDEFVRDVNNKVLTNATCSVGILIDNPQTRTVCERERQMLSVFERIAVLFIGGPDDRESLVFAANMAEHDHVTRLTVLQLRNDGAAGFDPEEEAKDRELWRKIKMRSKDTGKIEPIRSCESEERRRRSESDRIHDRKLRSVPLRKECGYVGIAGVQPSASESIPGIRSGRGHLRIFEFSGVGIGNSTVQIEKGSKSRYYGFRWRTGEHSQPISDIGEEQNEIGDR